MRTAVSPTRPNDVGVYFLLAHQWGHNVIIELAEEEKLDLAQPSRRSRSRRCPIAWRDLMIAGVPRVFADKDPDAVLGYAPAADRDVGWDNRHRGERQAAVQTGMAVSYDDRRAFVAGTDQCVQLYAPTIDGQRP